MSESTASYLGIVHLPEEEAREALASDGHRMRVRMRDGNPLFGTCDVDMNRVNVSVDGGVVTGVLGVG